jgi:AcrR family transcriptional regulator
VTPTSPARKTAAGRPARNRRGRPPRLTRQEILEAGLSLVRREGPEALTARALAKRIGASPMALYGHFASKQHLLAEIAAHAVEQMELRVPEGGSWRTILGSWLRSIRREFRAHPEFLPLLAAEGVLTRYLLTSVVRASEALTEAGLSRAAAVRAVQGSMLAVIGFVVCETAEPAKIRKVLPLLSADERERVAPMVPYLAFRNTDTMFEGMLARTLDGLAAEIERARTRAARRARRRKG